MDLRLLEAAYDLGARPWQAFWQITVPLISRPGVIAGAMLVFIPAVGEYVIPRNAGRRHHMLMMGRVMWSEIFQHADWPMGRGGDLRDGPAAVGACWPCSNTTRSSSVRTWPGVQAMSRAASWHARALALGLGFAFLYIPILSLVVFSSTIRPWSRPGPAFR